MTGHLYRSGVVWNLFALSLTGSRLVDEMADVIVLLFRGRWYPMLLGPCAGCLHAKHSC